MTYFELGPERYEDGSEVEKEEDGRQVTARPEAAQGGQQ